MLSAAVHAHGAGPSLCRRPARSWPPHVVATPTGGRASAPARNLPKQAHEDAALVRVQRGEETLAHPNLQLVHPGDMGLSELCQFEQGGATIRRVAPADHEAFMLQPVHNRRDIARRDAERLREVMHAQALAPDSAITCSRRIRGSESGRKEASPSGSMHWRAECLRDRAMR